MEKRKRGKEGKSKMIKEYRFKNPPNGQIKLERVSGANPEF